jgi:hypothetical protein
MAISQAAQNRMSGHDVPGTGLAGLFNRAGEHSPAIDSGGGYTDDVA